MQVRIETDYQHLGGTGKVIVEANVEPSQTNPFNVATADAMAEMMNVMLAAVLSERDRIRFDREQPAIRREPAQD